MKLWQLQRGTVIPPQSGTGCAPHDWFGDSAQPDPSTTSDAGGQETAPPELPLPPSGVVATPLDPRPLLLEEDPLPIEEGPPLLEEPEPEGWPLPLDPVSPLDEVELLAAKAPSTSPALAAAT